MSPPRRTILRRLQPLPVLALTTSWVLLWGRLSPLNVAGGLAIAVAVLLAFPLPPLALGVRVRPWPFVVLVARFLADLVVASCEVAYRCVAPWERPHGGLVRAPLRSADELFATVTAQMTMLVPGTIVIDLDRDRRELLIHVFDVRRPGVREAVRRDVLAQEERVLRALAARADEILAREPGLPTTDDRATQEER